MKVDLTEEWKDWVDWKVTRPEAANGHCTTLPIMNPLPPHEWYVYQPNSDINMVVPHEEFMTHHHAKLKMFKTRYDP